MQKKIGNATKICKTLWQTPGISRADLAKHLRIDKSTITAEITNLIQNGVISELPKLEEQNSLGGTGRKPIPLTLNKDYGVVLGISIQAGNYTMVAINMVGEIILSKEVEQSITASNIIDALTMIYKEFLKTLMHQEKLLGIGIGVGGLINQKDFSIGYSVTLDIDHPFSFLEEAKKQIPVPIVLENNANCCAWTELAFSRSFAVQNFLFLLLEFKQATVPHKRYGGVGIGLGIVLGGRVYYGANSFAGEFRSAFCNVDDEEQTSLSAEQMKNIMKDKEIQQKFISELAANIAMLVNTLDLGHVQVVGDIEEPGLAFCTELNKAIVHNWLFPVEKEVKIEYSSLGANTVAYGAAGKLVQTLFDSADIP
ncbi:ROK family protein [uncultured Sphaerochaeta sp.]|uniref:ROK family protein n=1 Tax=uncultured Sphaerochaeta sp. TaxID=886478 RepID=UPI002A0A817E|nr:ROK family protein [uncultured Sphaerochaeta sp.]